MKNMRSPFKSILIACMVTILIILQTGCPVEPRRHLIVVIDLSDGIEPEARNEVLQRIIDAFKGKKIHRGDSLTIIPVTSDAKTEAPGKVLHFVVKTESEREVNDADLKKVAREVEAQLTLLQQLGETSPYKQSDILGAIQIAGEEFSQHRNLEEEKELVVLSDMIQHNAVSHFETEKQLITIEAARNYGAAMAQNFGDQFRDVTVQIGLLRSVDLKTISPARREMIEEFWKAYLNTSGSKSVAFYTDGTMQIRNLFAE